MSIFGNINPEKQQALYKSTLKAGDVFLKKFDEAEHEKLFIVAGISEMKIYVCSIFINSKIHPSVQAKPNILKLHIPLLKNRNNFLDHDSFANCSYPIPLHSDRITKGIVDSTCKIIGTIHNQDLVFIQNALIDSGLLTDEQIELYFAKK